MNIESVSLHQQNNIAELPRLGKSQENFLFDSYLSSLFVWPFLQPTCDTYDKGRSKITCKIVFKPFQKRHTARTSEPMPSNALPLPSGKTSILDVKEFP